MADHTLDMLHSAVRAMNEVVLPAVDRGHPLALEQATLVTKILELLEQRLPTWTARVRLELQQQLALAQALAGDARAVSPALADALDDAVARAASVAADLDATPAACNLATRELGGLAALLVQAAAHADTALRRRVESAVVAAADPVFKLQRAWFLPQGWEPDPGAVPPLEQMLRPR